MSTPSRHRVDDAAVDPGAAPSSLAGVVRIMRFRARHGQASRLLEATQGNAAAARRAPGCLSAEVCTVPEHPHAVIVISRWESRAALEAFLGWHEAQAHDAVSPHAVGKPEAVHCRVVSAGRR